MHCSQANSIPCVCPTMCPTLLHSVACTCRLTQDDLNAIRSTARLAMLIPMASISSLHIPADVASSGRLQGGAEVASGGIMGDVEASASQLRRGVTFTDERRQQKGAYPATERQDGGNGGETRYFEAGGIDMKELKRRMEKIEQASQEGTFFGIKLPERVEKVAGRVKEGINDFQQAINFSKSCFSSCFATRWAWSTPWPR
jgi:hypothetical protein